MLGACAKHTREQQRIRENDAIRPSSELNCYHARHPAGCAVVPSFQSAIIFLCASEMSLQLPHRPVADAHRYRVYINLFQAQWAGCVHVYT